MKHNRLMFIYIVIAVVVATGVWVIASPKHVLAGDFSVRPYPVEGRSWLVYNNVKPGEIITDAVEVMNLSNKPERMAVYAVNARVLQDGGFSPNMEGAGGYIGSWVQLEKNEFMLEPNKSRVIRFTLRVPKNVESKEYIGAIVTGNQLDGAGGAPKGAGLGLVARVAVRVYLTVVGGTERLTKTTNSEFTQPKEDIKNSEIKNLQKLGRKVSTTNNLATSSVALGRASTTSDTMSRMLASLITDNQILLLKIAGFIIIVLLFIILLLI